MVNERADDNMNGLRYQVWFSGGPGTYPERYLCSEWQTLEAAQGYIEHYDHFGASWEIVEQQLPEPPKG